MKFATRLIPTVAAKKVIAATMVSQMLSTRSTMSAGFVRRSPNSTTVPAVMKSAMNEKNALGLLETQGLVAALHATDEMLKSAAVSLVGKEKIGAAYVTIMIRGDVAAVQSAISTGKQVVEKLGGKLIMADVIPRPHADLAALLPA